VIAIPEPTDAEFRRLRDIIEARTGIHLNPTKKALLQGRLARRLRQLGLSSFRQYCEEVGVRDGEVAELIDCVTTNETHFFREPHHFQYIERALVPEWLDEAERGRRPRAVRVWSAGCSTGEEPYSIAMVLLDRLPCDWTIEIIGTDISRRVLAKAMAATWPMARAREIPEHYLRSYMLHGIGEHEGELRASAPLRNVVRISWLNLNESELPRGYFDLVFCRNVLIYFDADRKKRLVERLLDRLEPGGRLFLGHAEGMHWSRDVHCVAPTVYARRKERQ
jgi:chemotaxis protein methyltransferase CheR